MSSIAPPPLQQDLLLPVVDTSGKKRFLIDPTWAIWLQQSLIPPVQASSTIIGTVSLTAQTATIATTPFPVPSLSGGLYSVSWYFRVTTAAGATSDATVTIGWSESGVALSKAGSLNNGNATTTIEVDKTFTFRADQASAITYAIAYNSNPAAAMNFRIDFIVRQIQ